LQNHLDVPKITKETLSFHSKARHPFSIMKESHPHCFQAQRRQEWCGSSLQSPSLHHSNKKTTRIVPGQTKNQTHWDAKISKFKKIQKFNFNVHAYINYGNYVAVLRTAMSVCG
jgi:hypothetical protein